jgi:hypothetical protein
MSTQRLYRVTFLNQGQAFEVYARKVSHGSIMGFIEIEKLVFGEKTSLLVDPAEEKLKTEFAGVERTYVPIHSVVRIDEVNAVSGDSPKVMPFPLYTNGGGEHKK